MGNLKNTTNTKKTKNIKKTKNVEQAKTTEETKEITFSLRLSTIRCLRIFAMLNFTPLDSYVDHALDNYMMTETSQGGIISKIHDICSLMR